MPNAGHLHITLPAQPDSLPVARRAIGAHAERLGVAEARIPDLKTVVSEACANVVRHAYPGDDETGTLELDFNSEPQQLSIVVRDFGGGVRPLSSDDVPSLRLGLPIIGALSSSFNLVSVLSCGTEITIRFARAG
jgi:anti-sigma regulatory factor (Ser/Thr protein kinase)